MPNFRTICVALLDEVSHESPTTCLARAALSEPQPELPTACEVTELVAWLLDGGEDAAANGWDHQARQFGRAAELLQRMQPKTPTDKDLDELFTEIDQSGAPESWRAYARAVLIRWGRPSLNDIEENKDYRIVSPEFYNAACTVLEHRGNNPETPDLSDPSVNGDFK